MKIKTSELTEGATLDWAVAKAQNTPVSDSDLVKLVLTTDYYKTSTDWSQGGPIIEREKIAIRENGDSDDWYACKRWDDHGMFGPTLLIAGLRCFVTSKLGNEIEIPEELYDNH